MHHPSRKSVWSFQAENDPLVKDAVGLESMIQSSSESGVQYFASLTDTVQDLDATSSRSTKDAALFQSNNHKIDTTKDIPLAMHSAVAIPSIDVGITPVALKGVPKISHPKKQSNEGSNTAQDSENEELLGNSRTRFTRNSTETAEEISGTLQESFTFPFDFSIDQPASDMPDGSIEIVNDDDILPSDTSPEMPLLTLLCSESFLERSPEAISSLASGCWCNSFFSTDKDHHSFGESAFVKGNGHRMSNLPRKIAICDCPLVDIVGVDIELSDQAALVIVFLSSWSCKMASSTTTQSKAKDFVRRAVKVAATGRYNCIHILLCVDADITSSVASEITMFQNALMRQNGCPCETVTFEFVSPRTLPSVIAQWALITVKKEQDWIEAYALDLKVQEGAQFLLSIVPTMTVHSVLWCIRHYSIKNSSPSLFSLELGDPKKALQKLIDDARGESKNALLDNSQSNGLSATSIIQLSLAVNTCLSNGKIG